MRDCLCGILLSAATLLSGVSAQFIAAQTTESTDYLNAESKDMAWWREARFGMFVHWGPVSLVGTEIGWSRGGERRGWRGGGTGEIPVGIYDTLYQRFNPLEFDAREWVNIARDAGMKYIVFTAKHHDGFSMFDSGLTDYKITNSPFRRDIARELAEACHEAGLRLGFYYSPPDWHHPDYQTENHARYVEYMHGQVRELCSKYGRVDILWFDSLQISPMEGSGGEADYPPEWAQTWNSRELFRTMRSLQPQILVNNRCGLPEDFDTPEQHIGFFQTGRPWESCITLCRQWAWKPGDDMKSLRECIQTLVRCAGGDGNLLLNVGPMPTGTIEQRQVERLREIGGWLRQYGMSVYNTRGGPFPPGDWGAATQRGDTIFVHLLNVTPGITVSLPPLDRNIVSQSLLTGGSARVRQTASATEITIPPSHSNGIDTIVRLVLKPAP